MDAEKFGAFVQARRKELGLSQAELAEKLFVTPKAVSRWERGVGFPDIKLLQPLADALGVTIVELMHSERMEQALTKEDASTLVTETVNQLEQQRQLTWKRRLLLYVGDALLILAYFFLHQLAMRYDWQPRWLAVPLIFISAYGYHYGLRALKAIMTGTPFPHQELKNPPMTKGAWLALGAFIGGMGLLLFALAKLDRHTGLRDFLAVTGLCLSLFGGVYFYQYTESYREKK